MLYHDFLIQREQLAESTQTYTKCYAESVSLEQYITGPHSQPKEMQSTFSKLLLQNKYISIFSFQLPFSMGALKTQLTLSLLMPYIYINIYIYMELLTKPEKVTSYIYGPTFGNAESHLFLFAAQCFNTESMQSRFLCHSCV